MKKHYVSYSLLAIIGLGGCTHSTNKPVAKCEDITEVPVGNQSFKVITVDCKTESLANKIKQAGSGDIVLVKGSCEETNTIEINQDGITLQGMGAKITGESDSNVISVNARGVTISHLDISGGLNGLVTSPNSRVKVNYLFIHDNIGFGLVSGKASVTRKDLAEMQAIIKNIRSTEDNTQSSPEPIVSEVANRSQVVFSTASIQDNTGRVTVCGMHNNNNEIGGVWVNRIAFDITCSGNQINNNGWIGLFSKKIGRTNIWGEATLQIAGNGHVEPRYGWGIALQASSNLTTYAGSNTNYEHNVNNQNITVDSTSTVNVKDGSTFIPTYP